MASQKQFSKVARMLACLFVVLLTSFAWDEASIHAAPHAQSDPIYAMPGKLEPATGQQFLTYFVTNDGTRYAIFGETPEVDDEITRIRDAAPDTVVKVWGELYASGQQFPGPEIVASSIVQEQPSAQPTPNNDPAIAIGRFDYVNLRAEPTQSSPISGQIILDEQCPILSRNNTNSWIRVQCESGMGWVTSTVVRLQGDLAAVPVSGPGSHTVQIPNVSDGGPTPVALGPTPIAPTAEPPANGWRVAYFANRDLMGDPVLIQDIPVINLDWGTGSPGTTVPVDGFSARFERVIDFPSGQYQLCVCNVDDGARMWIDGVLVLNDWRESPARDLVVERQLAGPHRVTIEYFEAINLASISFTSDLITTSGQDDWQASYWNNTLLEGPPVMTRMEERSAFTYVLENNWGKGSPAPGVITPDIFSARWEGLYYFEPGSYVFEATSDDGVRVIVDGMLVLRGWGDGYKNQRSGVYSIGQGLHQVRVEYYERTGDAFVRLRWYLDRSVRDQ